MREKMTSNWSRAAFLAVSMTLLGRSLQIDDGHVLDRHSTAIGWLTLGIAVAAFAIFVPSPVRINLRRFRWVVSLCLLFNVIQLSSKLPGPNLISNVSANLFVSFPSGVTTIAVLCAMVLATEGAERIVAFVGVIIATALLGQWMIINTHNPRIDVYVFQDQSSQVLLHGHNPYDMTYPNIYAPDDWVYAKGIVKNDRLLFGYPYFPEPLLAVLPAKLLKVDVRYTHLVEMLLAAILIVAARPGHITYAAAILFLTTPRLYSVLDQSWIEPITILGLAATVACSVRWPRLLPLALGFFFASKQYIPVAAILCFIDPRPMKQTMMLLVQAGVVALVITLPLALWNVHAFWHSAIELQFRQPFRFDALSYLAWMGQSFWSNRAIFLFPFVAMFSGVALLLWRRRSTTFAAGVAFSFLLFFAFNKQAFANYYFFVIGALACAMAELPASQDSTHHPVVLPTTT